MPVTKRYLILITIIVFILFPYKVYASSGIMLILIPGLTLEDLDSNANLANLAAAGGVGLMNTGAANKRLPSAYLSISAGKRAACPPGGVLALEVSETHALQFGNELYRRYTGFEPGANQIVFPFINQLIASNSPEIIPGLLGDALLSGGIPVILLGNQDLPNSPSRPGVLITMNRQGLLRYGNIDKSTNKISSFSPTCFTTNYDFIISKAEEFLNNTNALVVIDMGDLVRLDTLSEEIAQEHYLTVRQRLLDDIDAALGRLVEISRIKDNSIILLSPFPEKTRFLKGLTLTPAIFYSSDTVPGLLISQSTKRQGLITNLDIAPTITTLLGLNNNSDFRGNQFNVSPNPNSFAQLRKMNSIFTANYLQRPYLLKTYVFLQIISVLGFIVLLLLRHRGLRYVRTLLLALQVCPLLFLLLPLFPSYNIIWRLAVLLAALVIFTGFLEFRLPPLTRLAILFIITVLFLVTDICLGAPLMKTSLLGYDPISGARYYGIGNEYLGVLLGASLIGLTLCLEILRRSKPNHYIYSIAILLIFLGISYFVAAPQWGTNVGGGISFFSCFIILLLLINQKRLGFITLLITPLFTFFALTALFIYDLNRPEEAQSHIGLTARLIQEQGIISIFPIIKRKLSMNWKLFHYSMWSRVLITFLASLALLFYRPMGLFRKVFSDLPFLHSGLITGIIGTFIILLVNDSGIVAAATTMIYVAPTLLYLLSLKISPKKE